MNLAKSVCSACAKKLFQDVNGRSQIEMAEICTHDIPAGECVFRETAEFVFCESPDVPDCASACFGKRRFHKKRFAAVITAFERDAEGERKCARFLNPVRRNVPDAAVEAARTGIDQREIPGCGDAGRARTVKFVYLVGKCQILCHSRLLPVSVMRRLLLVFLQNVCFDELVDELLHGVEGCEEAVRGHDHADVALGKRSLAVFGRLEGDEVESDHAAREVNLSNAVRKDFLFFVHFQNLSLYCFVLECLLCVPC